MESRPEKKKSFWSTLPGILTGIAAVITAVTGLWLALNPSNPKGEELNPQKPTTEYALSESWAGSWNCQASDHEMQLTITDKDWSSTLKGYYPMAYGGNPAEEEYLIKELNDSTASGEYIYYDTSPLSGYQGRPGVWKGDWTIRSTTEGLVLIRMDHTTPWQREYICTRN